MKIRMSFELEVAIGFRLSGIQADAAPEIVPRTVTGRSGKA
jgi:hypothetical protein